jgi:L-alanine-DL-glutamate epimerase-like enolase superfamily enzyme
VFALESAILDLVSKARRCPAWVLLRGDELAAPIPLSALAEGATPEALADAAARASARGIRVVKIKVGGPDGLTRDPPRLAAVRARLAGAVSMRLDANQTLSPERLREALDVYAAFGPELLEEPALPEALARLDASPIPLALDESLMHEQWRERLHAAGQTGALRAVVLKPMTLGGFDRCLSIAEAAHDLGLAVVVTHVFDGPIGSAAAACLALAVHGETMPCGLDAHGRLEHPVSAIGHTHILPFKAHGLGVDTVIYDEMRDP